MFRCFNEVSFQIAWRKSAVPHMTSPERHMTFAFRKPIRISITIPYSTYDQLQRRSDQEGRSLSNLSAYLLEGAITQSSV